MNPEQFKRANQASGPCLENLRETHISRFVYPEALRHSVTFDSSVSATASDTITKEHGCRAFSSEIFGELMRTAQLRRT
jgi:hypothetical protein